MARVLYSGVDEHGQPSEVMLGCAIGDIIPHFGTTAPPGTLVCDGSEISREAYKELYKEIGALCGPGDGSTTFNLPDLRGKWMMGADAEHAAGEEVAEGLPNVVGTTTFASGADTELNLIRHITGCFKAYGIDDSHDSGEVAMNTQVGPPVRRSELRLNASWNNVIYGASAHVTPASVAVLPCIVYE